MSSGTWKAHGTVRRNLCHQGCFQTRKCTIFPISLFAFWTSAFDQGDRLLQAHLLFCGSFLFPRWHSTAHVALQNYSIHSFAPPKPQKQTCKKQSSGFLRMNFSLLWYLSLFTHTIPEPFPVTAPDPSTFPTLSHLLRSPGPAAIPPLPSVIMK